MSCPHGNPIGGCDTCDEVDAAFEAGKRSAMAEQQKPVAIVASHPERIDWLRDEPPDGTLLCTTPAQRKPWVGLTEQEAAECWSTSTVRTWQAIEAKLKEKNT